MITQEEKAKIFSLYWGQDIGWETNQKCPMDVCPEFFRYDKFFTLKVKPLSQISDEDALKVCKMAIPYTGRYEVIEIKNTSIIFKLPYIGVTYQIFPIRGLTFKLAKDGTSQSKNFSPCNAAINIIDFLRSKGYALPAYGHSVEELAKEGVFKLIEQ